MLWRYNPKLIQCLNRLDNGGVIAYPTEAVWGVGCDPFNEQAVEAVLQLKSRPWQKGLILIASDITQFDFLLHDVTDAHYTQLQLSWPGHNTWLVPHQQRIPEVVRGTHNSVAIRVSDHPVVRALCETHGGPIISTSANPAGKASAKTALAVRRYFHKTSLVLAPGHVGKQRSASCIRDLTSGKIIRSS